MAQLGGRQIQSRLTSLEVLSDDGKTVLMFDRNEDGTMKIRTRLPWESTWSNNGLTFNVGKDDAYILGFLLKSENVESWTFKTEKVATTDFTSDKPQSVIDAELGTKAGDCTELDIERAKAANLTEQKAVVELELKRDHANDKHVTADVAGCPTCDAKPPYQRGVPLTPDEVETIRENGRLGAEEVTGINDDLEELPF